MAKVVTPIVSDHVFLTLILTLRGSLTLITYGREVPQLVYGRSVLTSDTVHRNSAQGGGVEGSGESYTVYSNLVLRPHAQGERGWLLVRLCPIFDIGIGTKLDG